MPRRTIVEGDTKDWVYQLVDPGTDEPMDLTGATVVLNMWQLPSQSIVIDEGTVTHDDDGGTMTYSPVLADVDEPGTFQRQWVVTLSGGDEKSYPDLDVDSRDVLVIKHKVEATDTNAA